MPTTLDFSDLEPLTILERPEDPRTDRLRLEATAHPDPGQVDGEVDLGHERWVVDLKDEHVNPRWNEYFNVIAGELRVVTEDVEHTLEPGADIVIPADVPHRHWNPTGRPTRFRFEARPGLRLDRVFETLFALAQDGKTDERGLPNLLQFAVIQDAYPGYFYTTDLPRSVQRALATALAPIGRALGYSAAYPA